MNIALWIVQVLLALHTLAGAFWKLSNTEQAVPTLSAIPHGAWMALIAFEVLCVVGLVLPPMMKALGKAAPLAAVGIAAEMVLFSVVHLASGATDHGPVIYWLVVAAVCGFVAYGRFVRAPH